MATAHLPFLTPAQYLDLEEHSDSRHEYLDGVMYAMAGGTSVHSQLCVAVTAELRAALRGRNCRTFESNQRVAVDKTAYFYPDASVACGTGTDPTLIVEIISASTEAFDRTAKFNRYKAIESLREYVLVSQTAPLVETYLRGEDGRWVMSCFEGPKAVCCFTSLNVEIPIRTLYEGIDLRNDAA